MSNTDSEVSGNDGESGWNDADTKVTSREESVLRTEVEAWKPNDCGIMVK